MVGIGHAPWAFKQHPVRYCRRALQVAASYQAEATGGPRSNILTGTVRVLGGPANQSRTARPTTESLARKSSAP